MTAEEWFMALAPPDSTIQQSRTGEVWANPGTEQNVKQCKKIRYPVLLTI